MTSLEFWRFVAGQSTERRSKLFSATEQQAFIHFLKHGLTLQTSLIHISDCGDDGAPLQLIISDDQS
jgi:hypothetical protein